MNTENDTRMQDHRDEMLLEITSDIVCAFVSNNAIPAADLPGLIKAVHGSLEGARNEVSRIEAEAEKPKPAVPIRKSIQDDYIVCLEDGQKFKSLKRHLMTHYNLTPEQYREKWNLPSDYPMVAPNYAAARSRLAKEMGLGQKRKAA